jgi:hypothetical protein
MKARDVKSYAETFDTINRLEADGQWSQGRAAVERLQMAADINEALRPGWQKLLIFLLWASFIVGVVLLIIQAGALVVIASRVTG